jgi:hypothetical protein
MHDKGVGAATGGDQQHPCNSLSPLHGLTALHDHEQETGATQGCIGVGPASSAAGRLVADSPRPSPRGRISPSTTWLDPASSRFRMVASPSTLPVGGLVPKVPENASLTPYLSSGNASSQAEAQAQMTCCRRGHLRIHLQKNVQPRPRQSRRLNALNRIPCRNGPSKLRLTYLSPHVGGQHSPISTPSCTRLIGGDARRVKGMTHWALLCYTRHQIAP